MIINTNISSINAQRNFGATNTSMSKTLERLSSGLRINRAADDAAGLAISEKMRSQYRGLNQAVRNAQNGISMIQTTEGALNESHAILQRMRELAVQAATDTNTASDRQQIQAEVDQLAAELTRITNTTEFNTMNLLGGYFANQGNELYFHIGANKDQNMAVGVGAMDAFSLGVAAVGTKGIGIGAEAFTNLRASSGDLNGYVVKAQRANGALSSAATLSNAFVTGAGTATSVASAMTMTGTNTSSMSGLVQAQFTVDSKGYATGVQYRIGNSQWMKAEYTPTAYSAGGTVKLGDTGLSFTIAAGVGFSNDALATFGNVKSATVNATIFKSDGTTKVGSAVITGDEAYKLKLVSGTTTLGELNFTIGNLAAFDILLDKAVTATGGAVILSVIAQDSSAAEFTVDGSLKAGKEAVAAAGVYMGTREAANDAIATIDRAIGLVSNQRSTLGAYQNRLEHTINNLQVASENLTAAESRIRDADMAAEMSAFVRAQILSQAGVSMLAQANQLPQTVLKLLG